MRPFRRNGLYALVIAILAAPGVDAQESSSDDDKKDRLAERLLGEKSDDGGTMSRVVSLMAESEFRLTQEFDAGAETQRVQLTILRDLDDLIASSIRRGSGKPSQSKGDARRKSESADGATSGTGEQGASNESGESMARGGPVDTPQVRGALAERDRGWGHLPARDREAVIQGASERSIEKFRAWIDRYYQALAEEPSK